MDAAPVKITVQRFKCPHCARNWARKKAAETHAARCKHHPEYRGCKTCHFFERGENDDPATGYPGCGPSCLADQDISTDYKTRCEHWEQKRKHDCSRDCCPAH